MAVQARQHLSHAFRGTDDATAAFMDEFTARCAPAAGIADTTLLHDFPRGDLLLTSCDYVSFEPRKRARVSVALPPAPVTTTTVLQVPASGRVRGGSGGLLQSSSRLCGQQAAEIDALVRLETERMRAGLQDARRRHARSLLLAAAAASDSARLRAAEAELDRALRRNAELEDRVRQAAAECQAWAGVARSHEAVAAGLRAAIDQQVLLQSPCAAGAVGDAEAEDAQSCCFEAPATDAVASRSSRVRASSSCRACGGGEACVLLLPCRHLCLCRACEPAVHACPVCAAAKNASLHVVLA